MTGAHGLPGLLLDNGREVAAYIAGIAVYAVLSFLSAPLLAALVRSGRRHLLVGGAVCGFAAAFGAVLGSALVHRSTRSMVSPFVIAIAVAMTVAINLARLSDYGEMFPQEFRGEITGIVAGLAVTVLVISAG